MPYRDSLGLAITVAVHNPRLEHRTARALAAKIKADLDRLIRATRSAAQNRKSDPLSRIIVASTHAGIGGAESASVVGS